MVAEIRQRGPVRANVTVDRWEEAQMELAARRAEALAFCERLERPLTALYPACLEIGPAAEQLAAQALHAVQQYRRRQQ